MDLKEAIAALAAADRTEVIAALKADAPGLQQALFQEGHDVGYGKKHGELTAAESKVTELTSQVSTLTKDVDKLKKNPAVAELHTQYGQEIETLKAANAATVAELKGKITSSKADATTASLRAMLTSGAKRLDPDYAGVLTEKADTRARIKVADDGSIQILQAGKDIPIGAHTVEAALTVFAEELKAAAPAKFVLADTDKGGGTLQQRAPIPAGTGLAASIRETVAKEAAAVQERRPPGSRVRPGHERTT